MTCLITAISWERVNLSLTATLGPSDGAPGNVQFYIVDNTRSFPVKTTPAGHGRYRLEINVTNLQDRRQVPDGTWRFVPYIDGQPGTAAQYDLSALGRLDQDSRSFLYAANTVAYIVEFAISEDEEHPDFLMRTYQMFRRPKRRSDAPKPSLRQRIKRRLLPPARLTRLQNWVYQLARRFNPPRGNRILFASELRTGMEGNLARVHDRMVERGLKSKYEFRYSFRVPRIATKSTTLRTIYLLAISDIVLIDDYFAILETLQLSPATKVIQLWHAGSGFKAVGFSRFGTYGSPKLQNAHRKYTYAIAGSTHLVPVYAEAFGIEESAVIPTGLPRVDTLPRRRTDAEGRIVCLVTPQVRAALPPELLDYTDELEWLQVDVAVRARQKYVTWQLPYLGEPARFETVESDGPCLVRSGRVRLDIDSARLGRPLDETVWDLRTRTAWGGMVRAGALTYTGPTRPWLVNGRAADAYANMSGGLSVDLAGRMRTFATDAKPRGRAGAVAAFSAPLVNVVMSGAADLPADLVAIADDVDAAAVGEQVIKSLAEVGDLHARVVVSDGKARLVGGVDLLPGGYLIYARRDGELHRTRVRLQVGPDGKATFR